MAAPAAVIPASATTTTTPPTNPLFSLSNRTIAITGAGRGLGLTLAHAIVDAGAHVACLDILPTPDPAMWATLLSLANAAGVTATYDVCDVTSENDVQIVFEKISSHATSLGAELRGVVACAGIQKILKAVEYPAAEFERMLRVNTTGVFLTSKWAAKCMMARGVQGSIVLIASMSGSVGNRGLICSAYNTSKAAVIQMGRSLAQEWGMDGIRVNTLSPGVSSSRGFLSASRHLPVFVPFILAIHSSQLTSIPCYSTSAQT